MMRLASCLHHTVNGRSDYRTELCSVWEQQVNTALKLKQRADMISTFLNGDHVSVSSIHTRCRIAVKPLTTWEKTGGTRRTTTLSALLQVKANHSPATLGAFQLPQGIIEGLRCEEGNCCKWCRRRRQFKETTVGFLPAYTVQACQKKSLQSTPISSKFTLKCKETLDALQCNFPLTSSSPFKVLVFTSYLWPACMFVDLQ